MALEIVKQDVQTGRIRHALFDFDGTISLIRQGWQDIMTPLMVEVLAATPLAEPQDELERLVPEFIARTTGKQTIYQMMGLADMVRERGGEPLEALEYKKEYLRRLDIHIADRVNGLKAGTIQSETLIVPGAVDFLRALHERGVRCYLASGTDIGYVRAEAVALGVAHWFGEDIYGALDDWKSYSKAMVIERIIKENGLQGSELAAFGDGYVEIEEVVKVGGIAVGLATDEVGLTEVDAWKRQRLIKAGAQVIVPNFSSELVDWLFS